MTEYDDFQEIAHSGGRVTFHIKCEADGARSLSQSITHDRPTPAAWIGIYALAPHGIPVSDLQMGGIGQEFKPQPQAGWLVVFLGSDSRQCWGHQCPRCGGYFRNGHHPAVYPLTCPYCGLQTNAFRFLTPAQLSYVRHYIDTLLNGIEAEMAPGTQREFVINMDAIAAMDEGQPKPEYYYVSETQQTRYRCDHCGEFNDIRGRYGYCASCAWRNNGQFLKASFSALRERLNSHQIGPADTVRSAVSEFDACCRDFSVQLAKRVPMKRNRKIELERLVFHDLQSSSIASLKSMFDIDLLRGMADELSFAKLMMHRRHIYEHNGGVADDRYVRESGDQDARAGILIRESQANAHRLIGLLNRLIENFDADFHEVFPPTEWPLKYYSGRKR
ncbi:hypothetical protein [Bradyrhizobium sp. ORS 86]|uniref:hypothetical protein n=1 Tax=Bradyrhizobium sp. ORS 86 TaxID=1685970 RepID=UPI00388E4D26